VVVAVFFKDRCHLLDAWNFKGFNTEALHLPALLKIGFRFDCLAKKPLNQRERPLQQP
jgi:hypothetical protein